MSMPMVHCLSILLYSQRSIYLKSDGHFTLLFTLKSACAEAEGGIGVWTPPSPEKSQKYRVS